MFYNVISERIAKNLRGDLYESLINKDVEFFDSKKTGDLCKFALSHYLFHLKILKNFPSHTF